MKDMVSVIPSRGGEIFIESKYTKNPETSQVMSYTLEEKSVTKLCRVEYELNVASEVGAGHET